MKTYLPINLKPILILAFSALFSLQTYAAIRYVKPTATGTGDGSTWANASADIQAMIVASSSGDEVWVAAGLYKPLKDGAGSTSPTNVQNKVFWLKSGVKLYGGFAGTETLTSQRVITTNKTIFSGDIDNNDTNTDGNNIAENSSDIQGTNVYQLLILLNCDKTTVIDGIIFTAAQGTSSTSGFPGQTINGITIFPFYGSAINMTSGFALIKNCIFSGNKSFYGTVYHTNNTYIDSVRVISSVFAGNTTALGGGGMFMHRGNSYLNNVVMYNNNSSQGGAIMVSNNMDAAGKITIVNSTFVNNYSSIYKSMELELGIVKFYNVIIYNATPYSGGNINVNGSTVTSSYSLLQNSKNIGVWNNGYGTDGGNNYDLNPNFSNISSPIGADGSYFTSDDGLSLTSCSPAVNSGTNSIPINASVLTTDILGNTRPFSSGVADIGAYEFQSTSTRPDDATSVSSSSSSVTCGQSVTLSATCATGTVTWYLALGGGTSIGTGSGFTAIPLTNPTIYYASCESSSSCISLNRIATSSIAVTLPADPTSVSASNTAICPSTSVTLSATCTSPAVPEWYNGSTTLGTGTSFSVTPSATTTYTVKCKSGACLSVAGSITINVLGVPTGIGISNAYVCAGQQETFTATCAVGTVQWYTSSNTASLVGTGSPFITTPTPNASGYYHYYVTCSNGICTSNINASGATVNSFYFTPAPTVANSQVSICQGTTASLSATCALGTVQWFNASTGGTLLGTGSPLLQTPSSTNTYYAECYSSFGTACSSFRNSTQVIVSLPVTNPTSVSVDKTVICPSTSISLSATCATGTPTWYSQSTGGTALGTGSVFSQSPATTVTYYADCESSPCTPSSRIATSQIIVATIGSNLNLTTNISGTSVQASSNTITATNSILTGANVQYVANNSITLNPQAGGGFQVNSGAVFVARITPLTGCN